MRFTKKLQKTYPNCNKFVFKMGVEGAAIATVISQILNSIIIGIAAGAQPILGYNYGASNFDKE